MKRLPKVLIETVSSLKKHNVSDMAAALSFYALFAFVPVLLIMLWFARLLLIDVITQQRLITEMQLLFGTQIAEIMRNIIHTILTDPDIDSFAYWAGIASLCIGASSIFVQLERALHTLWNIDATPHSSIRVRVWKRVSSLFFLVISSALLLGILISNLFISIITVTFIKLFHWPNYLYSAIQSLVLFLSIVLLFAFLFRFVPRLKIAWSDILVGAGITGVLYMIGKYFLELYFRFATVGTVFGAAGSLIVFLLWLYYIALVFFFGAQFTFLYAKTIGHGVSSKT